MKAFGIKEEGREREREYQTNYLVVQFDKEDINKETKFQDCCSNHKRNRISVINNPLLLSVLLRMYNKNSII